MQAVTSPIVEQGFGNRATISWKPRRMRGIPSKTSSTTFTCDRWDCSFSKSAQWQLGCPWLGFGRESAQPPEPSGIAGRLRRDPQAMSCLSSRRFVSPELRASRMRQTTDVIVSLDLCPQLYLGATGALLSGFRAMVAHRPLLHPLPPSCPGGSPWTFLCVAFWR